MVPRPVLTAGATRVFDTVTRADDRVAAYSSRGPSWNPGLTPNALKAVVEYSAIPVSTDAGVLADALTQGAGQINGGGAATLAWMIDAGAPVGTEWLSNSSIPPSTQIGDERYMWAQAILWGNRRVSGANLMKEQRPAFALAIVWGDGLGLEDDNIVWGNSVVATLTSGRKEGKR